jgi:hypothetical protein
VVASNGNRWVGTGHSSIVNDLAVQQWFAYHAVDRSDLFVTGSNGWLLRPMLLDRLDWIDGWPTVNAGTGPSETSSAAPVTTSLSGALPADVRIEADLRTTGGVFARRSDTGSFVRAVVDAGRLVVEAVQHGRLTSRRDAALLHKPGNVALGGARQPGDG